MQLADRLRHLDELRRELTRTDERAVLQQHAQQHLHPLARRVGHLEQPQRVTGRRGVDDDDVVDGAGVDHGEDAEQLVDAGRREVHQLGGRRSPRRRPVGAERRGDLVERRFELRAPVGQRAGSVELADDQVRRRAGNRRRQRRRRRRGRRRRASAPGSVDSSSTRRRRSARASRTADRRRDGRLADAAFAAEEQERRVSANTRGRVGGQGLAGWRAGSWALRAGARFGP